MDNIILASWHHSFDDLAPKQQISGVIMDKVVERYMSDIMEEAKKEYQQKEQSMKDVIKKSKNYEKLKNDIKYEIIWDIGVVIYKWEPTSWYKYSKTNWFEFYSSIAYVFKEDDSRNRANKAWYDINNGKIYKKWVEISKFLTNWELNSDFVKAVDDISFMLDMRYTYGTQKTLKAWMKIEWTWDMTKEINIAIVSWVMRIKDVIFYAGKWYIPEKNIPILLTRAIQELPKQCSDMRFFQDINGARIWAEVTKDELDQYLKPAEWKPFITQSMYNDCLKRIEARDSKINEMNWVKEQSRSQREVEKTRNWFVDRVKWILWF